MKYRLHTQGLRADGVPRDHHAQLPHETARELQAAICSAQGLRFEERRLDSGARATSFHYIFIYYMLYILYIVCYILYIVCYIL